MPTIFRTYSLGVSTNRDAVAYDFNAKRLAERVEQFADNYNAELHRWQGKGRPRDIDNFVSSEKVKWSRDLKLKLAREVEIAFEKKFIRAALYRPYAKLHLYAANPVVDREGPVDLFPTKANMGTKNAAIALTGPGSEKPFVTLVVDTPFDLHLASFGSGTQAFPLYEFDESGSHRRDNITPKALTLFQIFYDDDGIARADIFHYVYALLHHPAYRTRYAENLKRELPRIPFIGVAADVRRLKSPAGGSQKKSEPPHVGCYDAGSFFPLSAIEKMQGDAKPDHNPKASAKLFHAFADAGKKLADLHVNYESAKEFPLQRQENKAVKLDWRVEAMKLSKDKASLFYNDFLTLSGIPPEIFDYKLGNRSALEWVIDQYRVTRDEHGHIASDPNRLDDEQYIVRLIGQVVTVSLETQEAVKEFPELRFE